MGQKINPIGFRLGVNRTWDSRWYADSADYGRLVHEDLKIRKTIKDELKQAGISRIVIERPHKKCIVTIHTARPGLVIGKKGADIEVLRKKLSKMTEDEVRVNLVEIRKPEIDSTLVAEDIARQLERRCRGRRRPPRGRRGGAARGWRRGRGRRRARGRGRERPAPPRRRRGPGPARGATGGPAADPRRGGAAGAGPGPDRCADVSVRRRAPGAGRGRGGRWRCRRGR